MSNIYVPPGNTKIPFNFTSKGYSIPYSTDISFDFRPLGNAGNLQAAINVLQPYWYETYSYPKSCPKYVIGYKNGQVQIIKGRCIYGGIRDLRGIITGVERGLVQKDLFSYINVVLNKSESDLNSNLVAVRPSDITGIIDTHTPENITAEIIGTRRTGLSDLDSFIGAHSPGDLNSFIATHQPKNLGAVVDGLKERGSNNIGGIVDTHSPSSLSGMVGVHEPKDIQASVRGWTNNTINLSAVLSAWSVGGLEASINTHIWGNLAAKIGGSGKGIEDLSSSLLGERYKGYNYLYSIINTHQPMDLGMSIVGVKSDYKILHSSIHGWIRTLLSSNINVHFPSNITGNIIGIKSDNSTIIGAIKGLISSYIDLHSSIGTHSPQDLIVDIKTHLPKDLQALSAGHLSNHLIAVLKPWYRNIQSNLNAFTKGWQDDNLNAYLGGILPRNLKVFIRVWEREVTKNLHANLYGWQQGPYLTALISVHSPSNFQSIIRVWHREVHKNLQAATWGWVENSLPAYIDIHIYNILKSSLRSWHRENIAYITASLQAYQTENLTAILGGHTWSGLTAKVLPHPPPPIIGIIRGWFRGAINNLSANMYGWQAGNLYTSIGAHLYKNLGIILKSVHVGIYNDLHTSLYGWQDNNLSAVVGVHSHQNLGSLLKGLFIEAFSNLYASVRGWQEGNLGAVTKGGHLPIDLVGHIRMVQHDYRNLNSYLRGWQENNLSSGIDIHFPAILKGSLRPWYSEIFSDIKANIYGWVESNLTGYIDIHNPENLKAIIKVADRVFRNLPSNIYGWEERFLSAGFSGTHFPVDLLSNLQVKQRTEGVLSAYLYAWQIKTLKASIKSIFYGDLNSYINIVAPADITAYLKVRPQYMLTASTVVWGTLDLGAHLNRIYDSYLIAKLNSVSDTHGILLAKLKGVGSGYVDLSSYIRSMSYYNLSAYLRPIYLKNLQAYLFPITPKNLQGLLHGWDIKFLSALLNGQDYPWNLTANILSTGYINILKAEISPKAAIAVFGNLIANCNPWDSKYLISNITGILTGFLSASLSASGNAFNLHASIRPKMVRLTTVLSIITMNSNNLSAIINYPCFMTGYSILNSSLYTVYKSDLLAYIRPIIYDYKPSLLGAKVGYSDSIIEVDKLKLSISIFPSEIFSEDKLKILFSIYKAGNLLNAYIQGILSNIGLSAGIVAIRPDRYTYPSPFKNREVIVHKTYAGIFEQFEYVEFSFKSMVNDYYYSSDGDYAWKKDRFERWILDVKSYLPANLSLRLKRRLHRATILYDLRSFASIDEAIRYAITFVTEYPQSSLGASIFNRGTFESLTSIINAIGIQNDISGLTSYISGIDNTIILGFSDKISKI